MLTFQHALGHLAYALLKENLFFFSMQETVKGNDVSDALPLTGFAYYQMAQNTEELCELYQTFSVRSLEETPKTTMSEGYKYNTALQTL